MKKPSVVLFDYGNTLIHEDPFDGVAGYAALLKLAVSNPEGITAEQLRLHNDELFEYLSEHAFPVGLEIHHHFFFRTLFDRFGLRFDLPFDRLETVYWDAASPGRAAPGIIDALDALHAQGIRTGVVSNISFSCAAMTQRLAHRLCGRPFEFVMTSSEYGVRKPKEFLFRAALGRCGVPAEEIWFCGDNPVADVAGSHRVGMQPVWYRSPLVYPETDRSKAKDIPHLYITRWEELTAAVDAAE